MDKLLMVSAVLIVALAAVVLFVPQLMQTAPSQSYDNQSYIAAQDSELDASLDSAWSNESDYVEIGEMI